jgi:AcrR family transcriptional regulator
VARPREHDEATRRVLLDVAARLLADEGPAAVTTRRVAAEAGTTTRAIYSLFGAKEGLLTALYREGFEGLAAAMADVTPDDDPGAELHALALAYRRSAQARPRLYDVMFGPPIAGVEPSPEDVEVAAGTLQRLADAVARCQAAGLLPDGDVWEPTRALWATVHGLAALELRGALGTPDEADAVWTRTITAVRHGL